MRVFGGSIGVAACTAILGSSSRRNLISTGLLTAQQLSTLRVSASDLTPVQLAAVREVYADAFRLEMQICAAISAACTICALGLYRRERLEILEIRVKQDERERERLRVKAEAEREGEGEK